jgi:hypothetical protein
MTLVSFIKKSSLRASHNIKKNNYQTIPKSILFQSTITPALFHLKCPKSVPTHQKRINIYQTLATQLGANV